MRCPSMMARSADELFFAAGPLVSPHTLKHVLAAVAAGFIVKWLAPARESSAAVRPITPRGCKRDYHAPGALRAVVMMSRPVAPGGHNSPKSVCRYVDSETSLYRDL